MAKETDVELFIGVDHEFKYPVLNEAEDAAIDVSGWAMSWMLKKKKSYADSAASITKTTSSGITVTGSWNATLASNTQRVVVAIADTDTDPLSAGTYFYELKRTGAGVETILAFGELELIRSVHRT